MAATAAARAGGLGASNLGGDCMTWGFGGDCMTRSFNGGGNGGDTSNI